MLEGAIIGGIAGLLAVIFIYFQKKQRFTSLMKSVTEPGVEYSGLFHVASEKRWRKSFKFFDSFGVLYLIGKTLHYKTTHGVAPMTFDLNECTVQQEPNWRMLKWFSITKPSGEKYYFDSHKMGAFVANSDETLRALSIIKSKMGATKPAHVPPPF